MIEVVVDEGARSASAVRRLFRRAGVVVEDGVDRAAAVAVPRIVGAVDLNDLVAAIDLDAAVAEVDVDRLLDRVDVDRLLDRVDVDRLLDRVDVDRLLDRVDVQALVERAGVGDLVAESTGQIGLSALDLARRQAAALDTIVLRLSSRLLGRELRSLPTGPPLLVATTTTAGPRRQVSGHYAGPVTRLVAVALDSALLSALFAVGVGVVTFGVQLVTGLDLRGDDGPGWWWVTVFAAWSFLYAYAGLALAGRTPGKGVAGLRVVGGDGSPLRSRQALLRVLTFPLSFALFGLGLVGVVVGRRRRALHDLLADSAVVYDWGDRPAELPTPLSRFLARRDHPPAAPFPLEESSHGS